LSSVNLFFIVLSAWTPNAKSKANRSEITVAALHSGKHVMCEKSMAINSTEAKAMLDAAKTTGKKLTSGWRDETCPRNRTNLKSGKKPIWLCESRRPRACLVGRSLTGEHLLNPSGLMCVIFRQ